MSFRGFQPTNGDEERKEWSSLSQTLASNVHKISQNVNQIQRLINQLETSEDSNDLRTQLHEVKETSAQLTRDTNSYLKELSQLPQLVQSMASVDQNRRNPLINSLNAYNNRKTNFVIDNNNSKQFSVEKFMTPSSIVSKKSNFYDGKTVFGGANASRAARLAGTTPYNLLQRHHLAPVLRVNVETSKRYVESSEPLSSSSQRILEKLEKASTPLQDARRIPTSVQHKNYFQTSDLLHRSTKRPKLGANPVFSQTTSEQPFEPKRWELKLSNKDDRKVSATETTDQLINSCDNKYLSDSIDNKSNESFGGKIMRRDSKREEKRTKPLTANGGQNDDLDLLTITQPLKMPSSLPKFNFGSNSSAAKPSPTTVLTKIIETQELSKDLIFKFSEPSLKMKDQKSDPVLSDLRTGKNGKKSFVFSSPLSAITHKSSNDFQKVEKESNVLKQSTPTSPETNLIESKTESKKSETSTEKWICVCLFQNISSDTKCKACKKDRISQLTAPLTSKANIRVESNVIKSSSTPITQNTTIGWGNHFKPPSGSWSCSVCMVSNPSDKTKCMACEEPKPGSTPSMSTNDSQWGIKLKPPTGSWSCSVCMVSNPSDETRCLACEQPKPGAVSSSTKDSPKGQSGLWQCFYCQHNNEMSKTVCTSCAKIKTAVATKEDLNKLYGGQTFKFGVTHEIKDTKTENKEKPHSNEGKTDIFNKTINNSIFSKSNISTSQTSASNSFVFGSTASEEKNKLSNSFVPKLSNTSDGAKSLFKFGAPPESSKPISEVNPTEKTNTNISDIFGLSKASNPSFSFGSPSTTSTSTNPKPTVDSQLFVFGSQNKEPDSMKSKKNVSFELEDKNKSSSDAFINKSSTDSTPLSFQIPKPSEDNQQIFKNFNSSSSGSLFGLTSSTTKDATPVATVSSTVSITSFMDNKFTSKSNESQNKSIGSLFGGPVSTTASASFSSPFSLTNSFSGQKSTPTTGQNAVSVANDTKSLFSLTPSSSIKSFDSIISSQTNQMTTNSSATPTAPLGLSNSSSQQKGLVFGNSNPSLQSFSSQSSAATTKPNFSFNLSANTGANTTATTTDSAFGSNASTLFGSNPSKGFNFGTSSLNSSQQAFSFTIPSTNSLSNTSSNINFGLNSNAINTTSAETNSKTANSLFAFGGQNSDQSFTSPLTQKPSNNTNTNSKTSSQFSFGLTSNPSTGQQNSNNLFANAINPTQNSLSFNQMSGTAAAANPPPFTFGGFGTTPSAPASMPQLQNQSQQQPPIPPPAFNFSAQPSFDFTSIPNAGTQPTGPVFQFSADQTSQAVVASNRNIKKAKRRLNPT